MKQPALIHQVRKDIKGGLKVVYKRAKNNYLHVVIGDNGYIVTAYPRSDPDPVDSVRD